MFASYKPKNHVKLPFENERLPVDVLNKKSRPLSYFLITSGCDELTRKIKNSKNSSKSFKCWKQNMQAWINARKHLKK